MQITRFSLQSQYESLKVDDKKKIKKNKVTFIIYILWFVDHMFFHLEYFFIDMVCGYFSFYLYYTFLKFMKHQKICIFFFILVYFDDEWTSLIAK